LADFSEPKKIVGLREGISYFFLQQQLHPTSVFAIDPVVAPRAKMAHKLLEKSIKAAIEF
jgi:hypothetical protein